MLIWLEKAHGEGKQYLQQTITQKAADMMVGESDHAICDERLPVVNLDVFILRRRGVAWSATGVVESQLVGAWYGVHQP